MDNTIDSPVKRIIFMFAMLLTLGIVIVSAAEAITVNVNGVQKDGTLVPVSEYRWLIEEDATYHVNQGLPDPNTLAVSFHTSYMPVVNEGTEADSLPVLDPLKHYYISILPDSGFTIGGAQIAPGQTDVTVYVNALPLPTAQITVFVFEDTEPINNAPDLPEEQGLEGFSIVLEDAGGRYGISAGVMSQDAFGNPLGTTYNPDGSVAVLGNGTIMTDANGVAVIKNLAPGKYGVIVVPPSGQGWQQTTTIEGKKVIDAWVKANEPPFFAEFGPAGVHAFFGFVRPFVDSTVLSGGPNSATISGQVTNLHLSAPPDNAFYGGAPFPHTNCWVGLNDLGVGIGRGVYAQPCDVDGNFSILNVPPGNYQLAIWDDNLDQIIAFHGITVNPDGSCATLNGSCALGDVPVFQWFTRLENWVFYDGNENGIREEGEAGILEQAINIRWRDGTVYQSFPTDLDGFVPFDEVFPFFAWLVAEVDFARFKATGVTVTVDAGGPIDSTDPWTWGGQLNPQPQSENGGFPYRTETGPVLTQAFQGFIGQTSVIEWGKKAYDPGENGGISGIVYYATTRAEDDPAYAAAEPWEPGIPGVTVNLYDSEGMLVDSTTTDSWDDSLPTGCQGDPFIFMGVPTDCYDGLRNWNQIRPGIFDGGYAFNNISAGEYIVEVIPPPGYKIVKEEDKNVDFGDEYEVSTLLLPPNCVNWADENDDGNPGHLVPAELSLFPEVPSFYAGQYRPICDRKRVYLSNGQNAAADFFLFTEVPISSHIRGFILDDSSNEFDPNSPNFGEKYAPPWMPVSVRDWTGREIGRTYSDQYGLFNVLVPSTYTMNLPMPSGASPNMLTTCMNDPILPNGEPDIYHNPQYSTFCYTFQYMPGTTTYLDTPVIPIAAFAGPDQFPLDCEPEAGVPKIRTVSVHGNGVGGGPYAPAVVTIEPVTGDINQVTDQAYTIVIESMGTMDVPNPEFDGIGGVEPKTTPRDFGFGISQGSVMLGDTALSIVSWASDAIIAEVPAGTRAGSYQLTITRGDNGNSTIAGSVVTVGLKTDDEGVLIQGVVTVDDDRVENPAATYVSIQEAIDNAGVRDLILVAPGTYSEMVVMWKPVRLQGWGTGSTMINAVKAPAEKLVAWRQKVGNLIALGAVDLLPAQEAGVGVLEPATLFTEEGAGIIVLAKATDDVASFGKNENRGARIDGLSIYNADTGGGIVVNGYADFLEIGNNVIRNNSGFYGGGIRVGHPQLVLDTGQGLEYQDADNDNISIHHSYVTQNGGLNGAGGGISLNTGSDNYRVTDSYICGNFSLADGAGIGHLGLSEDGLIANNKIIFNENFNQGATVSGGGIFISGQAPLGGPGSLTPGSGSVDIIENLIQGNASGVGDGGGIRTSRVNGDDIDRFRNNTNRWYTINMFDNIIVNNVAALAGGGISMQDTVKINIIHNTIANNDSTATASEAFTPGNPNQSNPQPAGIVSRGHSSELNVALDDTGRRVPGELKVTFSNPRLVDNIFWHNRSFYFFGDPLADPPLYVLLPDVAGGDPPVYNDLAVIGTAVASQLSPTYSILTDMTGYDPSNISADPTFALGYENGGRGTTVIPGEPTTALQVPVAFDEGGNAIRVGFGPLTLGGSDYHIQSGSPATDAGLDLTAEIPELSDDFDGDARPNGSGVDMGADEL